LRQLEWTVYLSAQSQLDYQLSRASWIGDYNDPQTFLGMFTSNDGNNRTGWKNPRYDSLIREAGGERDLEKRAKIFQQAEELLVQDEAPVIPLFFYAGINYFDTNKITGIYENILDDHPLNYIRRIGRGTKVESREPEAARLN